MMNESSHHTCQPQEEASHTSSHAGVRAPGYPPPKSLILVHTLASSVLAAAGEGPTHASDVLRLVHGLAQHRRLGQGPWSTTSIDKHESVGICRRHHHTNITRISERLLCQTTPTRPRSVLAHHHRHTYVRQACDGEGTERGTRQLHHVIISLCVSRLCCAQPWRCNGGLGEEEMKEECAMWDVNQVTQPPHMMPHAADSKQQPIFTHAAWQTEAENGDTLAKGGPQVAGTVDGQRGRHTP